MPSPTLRILANAASIDYGWLTVKRYRYFETTYIGDLRVHR
jgi:hypothetical protein